MGGAFGVFRGEACLAPEYPHDDSGRGLTIDDLPCMLWVSYLELSIGAGGDNFKERMVSDSRQLAEEFLKALAANDAANYAVLLDEQAGLRVWHWRGQDVRRPRERVVARLMEEWSAWLDASVETLGIVAEGERAAIEYRI